MIAYYRPNEISYQIADLHDPKYTHTAEKVVGWKYSSIFLWIMYVIGVLLCFVSPDFTHIFRGYFAEIEDNRHHQ